METGIRLLPQEQIAPALELAWRVFSAFEAPEYTQRGIQEFQQFIQPESIVLKMRQGEMVLWDYVRNGTVAGMIAITVTGHINLLFVDANYHRQGIARALYQQAVEYFHMRGVLKITVNSSPYAVAVYRRFGFLETAEEQTVNGIRFIPMALQVESAHSV